VTDFHIPPGEGNTQISYAGPRDLERDLPQRDPAGARALAADLAARAERAVENSLFQVGRLRPPYPDWVDGMTMRLVDGARRASALASGTGDPFTALAQVRALAQEVETDAAGLTEIARGVIQGRSR